MRNIVYSTIAGSLLAASSAVAGDTAVTPPASTGDFKQTLGLGYHTKYIFRGVDLGDDQATASYEFTKTCPLTGLDITAGAWGSRVFDNAAGNVQAELDLYANVTKDLGFAKATLGYIFYHNFDDADDAQEVTFGLSKEILGFNTSLTYFWDVETDNQGYTELAIDKTFTCPVSKVSGIKAGLKLGYLVEEGALSHLTGTVSKSFEVAQGLAITPYVAYTVELDDLEVFSGKPEQNEFFAGVGVTYTF